MIVVTTILLYQLQNIISFQVAKVYEERINAFTSYKNINYEELEAIKFKT